MDHQNDDDSTADPAAIWAELDPETKAQVAKLFIHLAYCFMVAGTAAAATSGEDESLKYEEGEKKYPH